MSDNEGLITVMSDAEREHYLNYGRGYTPDEWVKLRRAQAQQPALAAEALKPFIDGVRNIARRIGGHVLGHPGVREKVD